VTNIAIKSKSFNILTTPVVAVATVESVLEAGARIVGVLLSGTAVGDTAAVTITLFNALTGDIPVAALQLTPAGSLVSRQWWAGLNGRYNDTQVLYSGVANTTVGYWPLAAFPKVSEYNTGLGDYTMRIAISTALFGQVVVLYTTDPPNSYGEST
jgi:hypothetical protein